jgi:pimeloyl-ACP methyl ester carboxylesterase
MAAMAIRQVVFKQLSPSDVRMDRAHDTRVIETLRTADGLQRLGAVNKQLAARSDSEPLSGRARCAPMTLPLYAESRGSGGLPVLFAHSFAGDCSHWHATLEHLKPQRRVVAFDFSGHGRSPGALGAYSIGDLAKDIGAVADAQQLDAFVLVGHSMGAAAAAEYAGSHPSRVKALVLVDPPPAPGAIPPEQVAQLRAAVTKDPYSVIEQFWNQQMLIDTRAEVKQRLLSAMRAMTRRAAAELTQASLDYDARAALSRYPGPKFAIITARNDAPLSLHNAVPGFRHVVIRGTGHWIQLDRPEDFNKALDGFLSTL